MVHIESIPFNQKTSCPSSPVELTNNRNITAQARIIMMPVATGAGGADNASAPTVTSAGQASAARLAKHRALMGLTGKQVRVYVCACAYVCVCVFDMSDQ